MRTPVSSRLKNWDAHLGTQLIHGDIVWNRPENCIRFSNKLGWLSGMSDRAQPVDIEDLW